jgi:hypothetical protein
MGYLCHLCYDLAMGFRKPSFFTTHALMALGALGCAGRPATPGEPIGKSSELGSRPGPSDAGKADDAGVKAATALTARDVHFDAGVEDPSHLLKDANRNQVDSPGSAGPVGGSGLVLHVAERGPNKPWIITVSNEGDVPAFLVADTRLLWLEVQPSGSKKTSHCRLPADLMPKEAEPRLNVNLAPGESVAQLIDPRLYCFASGEQKLLVPGARVVPHLGWPELPDKTSWNKGRKVSSPVPQPPPYIAYHADLDVDSALQARTAALKVAKSARVRNRAPKVNDESLGVPLPAGIDKQLKGPELTLKDAYAEWTSTKRKVRGGNPDESPLELRVVQGSDARTEHNATVQITLRNRSKRRVLVYFRREFVTYEVAGPAGVQICNPAPDVRAPDREAFVTLAAGASRSYSNRLAEMCPRDTFDMPGLYIVNATYDATETGARWNLAAFTGSVASNKPSNVRIRTGELSFLHKVALRPVDESTANRTAAPVDAGSAP